MFKSLFFALFWHLWLCWRASYFISDHLLLKNLLRTLSHSWKSSIIIIIIITVDSCANEYLVVANGIWNQWKQHITLFFWWNWFIFDPLNFSSVVSILHSSLNDLQVCTGDLSVRQSLKTVHDKIIHFRHFCFSNTVKALVQIKNNLLLTQNTDTSKSKMNEYVRLIEMSD